MDLPRDSILLKNLYENIYTEYNLAVTTIIIYPCIHVKIIWPKNK